MVDFPQERFVLTRVNGYDAMLVSVRARSGLQLLALATFCSRARAASLGRPQNEFHSFLIIPFISFQTPAGLISIVLVITRARSDHEALHHEPHLTPPTMYMQ